MAFALLQMASPCNTLGHCTALGRRMGVESELEYIKTQKRVHAGMVEFDRGNVKKRRKQLKPVRIALSDSLSDDEGFVNCNRDKITYYNGETASVSSDVAIETTCPDASNSVGHELSNPKSDCEEDFVGASVQYHGERSVYLESLYPLNLSHVKQSPVSSYAETLATSHSLQVLSGRTTQQTPLDVSDPPYQVPSSNGVQFNNQLLQDNLQLSSISSPLVLPPLKQVQTPTNVGSPFRIFNPEAFCDLCNKEFCNKYFLKTHKANKHGIYSENIGPMVIDALPTMPFINYFANRDLVSFLPRTVPKKPTSIVSGLSQFPFKSNVSNGNMRGFCNICQRDFCNKYFVRKHKAKIHGIVESNSSDGASVENVDVKQQREVTTPQGSGNSRDRNEFQSTDFEAFFGTPNVKPSHQTEKEILPKTTVHTSNKDSRIIKQEHDAEYEDENNPSHGTSSSPFNFFFSSIKIDDRLKEKQESLSPDKLRQLGVVNTDAFCDICCKEYCNKYFLRTHKLKSHGILPTEQEKKDDRLHDNDQFSMFGSQAFPLNLIVNDHNINTPDTFSKIIVESDLDAKNCNVCGRHFQNNFLLRMHYAYVHASNTNDMRDDDSQKNSSVIQRNSNIPKQKESESNIVKEQEHNLNNTGQVSPADIMGIAKVFHVDNLQKLHSMILKLNSATSGNQTNCDLCDKDMGSIALLETHIMKVHSSLLEEIGNTVEEGDSNSQISPTTSYELSKYYCQHCQNSFLSESSLEQHLIDCHSGPCQEENLTIETTPNKMEKDDEELGKSAEVLLHPNNDTLGLSTPTSSFCEICKKELCNKYFMKTHMQRMHGISIENGAHIGGVVCDICNKELCSKYFLRVHKQNSHGIVEEVLLSQLSVDSIRNNCPSVSKDPALIPTEQNDLSHRYFSHFTEVCMICSRRFRSTKWLRAHLLNDHGEEGKDKWKVYRTQMDLTPSQIDSFAKGILKNSETTKHDFSNGMSPLGEIYIPGLEAAGPSYKGVIEPNPSMLPNVYNMKNSKQYQCSYCSFTTSIHALLFVHERVHINATPSFLSENERTFQCRVCMKSFASKDKLEKHISSHRITGVAQYLDDTLQENPEIFDSNKKTRINECPNGVSSLAGEDVSYIPKRKEVSLKPVTVVTSKVDNNFNKTNIPYNTGSIDDKSLKIHDSSITKRGNSALQFIEQRSVSDNVAAYNEQLLKNPTSTDRGPDLDLLAMLEKARDTLSQIVTKAQVPASFAVPNTHGHFMMQPFVLEDSNGLNEPNSSLDFPVPKTFLSSLVFLPVREKLHKPITASFKLTPT